MLSERALFRLLVAVLIAGTVIGVTLALVVPAHGKTTVEAMRLVVPRYTPAVPVQRIGLNCHHTEYLIWGARYCVTVRARKDHQGRWWFQSAAAVAGYNGQGRRSMRLVAAVRSGGRTTSDAAKGKRLVVRGRWRLGTGQADDTKAVFVIRWPNERKSAVKLSVRG